MSQQQSNSHHVLSDNNGGWLVKKPGLQSYGYFATQQEAIDVAKNLSRNEGTQYVVHEKNGEIRQNKKRVSLKK